MDTKAIRDYNHQDLYIHACIHPGFHMIDRDLRHERNINAINACLINPSIL